MLLGGVGGEPLTALPPAAAAADFDQGEADSMQQCEQIGAVRMQSARCTANRCFAPRLAACTMPGPARLPAEQLVHRAWPQLRRSSAAVQAAEGPSCGWGELTWEAEGVFGPMQPRHAQAHMVSLLCC